MTVKHGLLTKLLKNPLITFNASATEEFSEYPEQINKKYIHFETT